FSLEIRYLICRGYLLSIITVAVSVYIFILMGIYKRFDRVLNKIYISIGIIIAGATGVIALPIHIYKAEAYYTYGASVVLTYVVSVFFLVASFYNIIRYRKVLGKQKVRSIGFFLASWLIAAIIQFMFNAFLIVGFAMGFGVTYVYLKLENPEVNYDLMTGTFNSYAFRNYLNHLQDIEKPFYVIGVKLEDFDYYNEVFDVKNSNIIRGKLVEYFNDIEGARIFSINGQVFFAVFLDRELMQEALRRIGNRFKKPWYLDEVSFYLGAGICYVEDANVAASLNNPSEMLYHFLMNEKNTGPDNIFCIDETVVDGYTRAMMLERTARNTVEQGNIEVYYQPIYDVEKAGYTSAEALIRVFNENSNLLPTDLFIRVAEQNGTILRVGRIVLEKVCQFISSDVFETLGLERVHVNLSVVQCLQPKLSEEILDIIYDYNVDPKYICLEITETALVSTKGVVMDNIRRLQKAGISIVLDDYGVGFISNALLMDSPVKMVKLNRSFIKSDLLLELTVKMLRYMGMTLIAEDVEYEEQYRLLTDLGVEYVQGYYNSRPLPQEEFVEMLTDNLNN
ncbi:MAG: EAL domain-containing protein, partial [Lachnospiraceae bacterium]|nr:EAL domain-containing protein [Lachnospiraceae bacterium]